MKKTTLTRITTIAMAITFALLVCGPTLWTAEADEHHGHHHEEHRGHYGHDPGYYTAPVPNYYYAPPPNYYYTPEPNYYYAPNGDYYASPPPPSQGINLFFGIH